MPAINNKKIGIDFLLFFVLLLNFVFTLQNRHYISFIPFSAPPGNFTFVFLAFALIATYFFISRAELAEKKKFYLKTGIVFFAVIFFLATAVFNQIILREKSTRPDFELYYVHDGVVATEEATKALAAGHNPYAVDYRQTPFGIFPNTYAKDYGDEGRENPAWTHYVYLPFLSVFSLPFYKISESIFSFYDQRIVYGLLFLLGLIFLYKLPENKNKKIIGLLIFAFNPLFFPYFIQGYNDIFVFFWLLASLYFLKAKKLPWSLVFLGLACASKQSAWLILPFYFSYLYFLEEKARTFGQKIIILLKKSWPFIFVGLIIFLPFLLWGFNDFIDDIYRYPAGTIESNFPMVGSGISHLIYKIGFVKSIWDYFPFWIFQLIIAGPLLIFLIKGQKKDNSLSRLVFSYGIFLLVFWFFSRFFNDNYISYLSLIFLTGYLIEEREEKSLAEISR